MKRIKLSQIDRLEIENAILKMNIARQNLDNLVEKKAIIQRIKILSEWMFDFLTFEFVEIEKKPKEEEKK